MTHPSSWSWFFGRRQADTLLPFLFPDPPRTHYLLLLSVFPHLVVKPQNLDLEGP